MAKGGKSYIVHEQRGSLAEARVSLIWPCIIVRNTMGLKANKGSAGSIWHKTCLSAKRLVGPPQTGATTNLITRKARRKGRQLCRSYLQAANFGQASQRKSRISSIATRAGVLLNS